MAGVSNRGRLDERDGSGSRIVAASDPLVLRDAPFWRSSA
jgi:hypothetical protein